MKNRLKFLSSLLLALSCAAVAFGQTDSKLGSVGEPTRGIKNKPYSAESIRENVRTLADGNTITETLKGLEYRDSQGRTRREEVSQSPPRSFSSNLINIYDPVGGYTYSINAGEKTAFRIKLPPLRQAYPMQEPAGYSRKTEPLGARIIEGIEARGTRGISTIAPGTVGNEKEIQMTGEAWSSAELALTLLTISHDPRYGTTTTRLINIKRDEPDKSLFEIPADYKIIDREPLRPREPAPNPANNNPNENSKP